MGLGLEESLRFRGPMALGARRAPPAALGAAGYSEPPPPQLSQSLRGERGGVRGAVKRRRGRQVSKIAALCALRSPDSQPVGGAPAYRAQPRPGPAANQLRISPRPTPDQPRTSPTPTPDQAGTGPATHSGPAPSRQQRLAASRQPAPRAPRDTGATADPRPRVAAVWPALDRDAPQRLELESPPVGTREVRGEVRATAVLGNRGRNALSRPRGAPPPRIGTQAADTFLRLERLAWALGPGCSRRARCCAQDRKRPHSRSGEVPHRAGRGGTRGTGRSTRDCDALPKFLC